MILSSFFQTIAKIISSGWGVTIASIGIFIFAGWQYKLNLSNKLQPIINDFEKGIKFLSSYQSPEEFIEGYEDFETDIMDVETIGKVWHDYSKQLIIPGREDRETVITFSLPAGNYFYLENLGLNHALVNRLNSIPGQLTGLGILGTFIGLAAGIYLAQQGLQADNVKEVTRALGFLLEGASLAFITSIFGLLTSMVFSWRKYKLFHRTEELIENWNVTLEKKMRFANDGEVLIKSLKEQKDQTTQLKQFNTQLATQIGKALEEKLSGSITPLLEKLVTGIESLSSTQENLGTDAIEKTMAGFQSSMGNQIAEQMRNLGETFQSLHGTLDRSAELLNKGQLDITAQSNAYSEKIEQSLEKTADILDKKFQNKIEQFSEDLLSKSELATKNLFTTINAANLNLKESFEHLNRAIVELGTTSEMVLEGATAQRLSNSETIKVLGIMDDSSKAIINATEPLKNVSQNLFDSTKNISEIASQLQSATSEIGNSTTQILASNDLIKNSWVNYQERFENVDESLESIMKEMLNGLGDYTSNVQNFHKHLENQVAEIIGKLSGAIGEFDESIQELSETMQEKEIN